MGQPENGFQAAYVCFGEVLMREYAFRFAYDSLRVSRILQSSPWSMFLGGAFFVSLFGSGLLAVDFQATECQFCECDGGDYDGYVGQNGVGYVGARLAREAGVRAIKRCANKHLAIGGDGN